MKELQASLKEIDTLRLAKDVSDSEREALELTAVSLRDAERLRDKLMSEALGR